MATPSVFDLASAQRIAAAVRKVEIGDRTESALRFRRELPQQQRRVFRIATFTGSWEINQTRQITFVNQTATVSVENKFFDFRGSTATSEVYECGVARQAGQWYLISVPDNRETVAIITGVTLSTAGLVFTRASVAVHSSATMTITTIGTTAC